jgi:hypothetical protein
MRVPILHSSLSIYCRILLTLACLAGPFATLLAGQTRDPVSEALSLMNKGQLDKALELLTLLEAADQEPKGAEYLLGAELNRPSEWPSIARATSILLYCRHLQASDS